MKILIVEDEKQLLDSMITFLKESGMTCDKAINLAEAIEKIDHSVYDCIVLDIGLPDGSGLKVINEMQQKENQTAIVIVSAKNSLDDRLIGLNFGADDYITKPFYMPELVARIKSVVRRRSFQEKNEIVFGKCANENWHGHNYELYVTIKGEVVEDTGFLFDVKILSLLINKFVLDKLDHKNLNVDVDFLKGQMCSTENLVKAIWQQLKPHLPQQVQLHCIKLYETPRIYVEYFGD